MLKKRLLILLLIVVLLAPMSALAQDGEKERRGIRPDAPTYGVRGPYWVGTREFVIDPDSERPIKITVWYPALNPDGLEESVTYTDIEFKYGELPPDIVLQAYGQAILDAEPDTASGPYPLIISSTGWGWVRQGMSYLTEHLASHGFVVIAPDHIEQFGGVEERIPPLVDRPRDIQRTIAYAQNLSSQGGEFEGMIDVNNTGVTGWSYGGYTTLAAGGARFDFEALATKCADVPDDDPKKRYCSALGHEEEMAEMAGLDSVPEGLWPSMGDPHVKAIAPLAGDAYMSWETGLAEITVPTMAMTGSIDTGTYPEWGAALTYESVSSERKALVMFENAEHSIFGDHCRRLPEMAALFYPWGCPADPTWDLDRAHDLINHFVTAFFLSELKGDEEAKAALMPEAVAFPGINYETTFQ